MKAVWACNREVCTSWNLKPIMAHLFYLGICNKPVPMLGILSMFPCKVTAGWF